MTTTCPTEHLMTVGRDAHLIDGATGIIFASTTGEDHLFIEISGRIYRPCPRCVNGSGTLEQHTNIFGGVCFGCDGRGLDAIVKGGRGELPKIVRRREGQRRRYEAKRQERAAARLDAAGRRWQAQLDAWHEEALEIDALRATQRYAGEQGDTVTVTGTVEVAMWLENRFGGMSRLVVIDSGDGVAVKFFSASKATAALAEGQQVTVTGTVAKHEMYRDTKQTLISRPKYA